MLRNEQIILEKNTLERWAKNDIFGQLKYKNAGKPKWLFLDGPITANNPMGVHHAWGRTYKDVFQRYFSMNGYSLHYQNGFDCQGLWVEVEVEKELGIKSKKEILNLKDNEYMSLAYFVDRCKERVDHFARKQTEQSIRLGYWMNWDKQSDWDIDPDARKSYYTHSDRNNYAIWGFLKKCWDEGMLKEDKDVVPWCTRCECTISQMEMHEGYKPTRHRSAYVAFPLSERGSEYLLAWTTQPWTLIANSALAVNPSAMYVKVRHNDKVYYISEDTKDKFFAGMTILERMHGEKLAGLRYPSTLRVAIDRRVWISDTVNPAEGTGIVHIAPSCGKEDFDLAKKRVPVDSFFDEGGFCTAENPDYKGKYYTELNKIVLDKVREMNLLFAEEDIDHSYPHCWRCNTPLIFRLTDNWVIDPDVGKPSLRERLIEQCKKIKWIPEFGQQRELDWLRNMSKWIISKKRFWGLALPIWKCSKCNQVEVFRSKEDLHRRVGISDWGHFIGHTPHRPWIDEIRVSCKCGHYKTRIPDVGNCWLDAGIVPFSTALKGDVPVEMITESFPGQFRNWFYVLMLMSEVMAKKPPTKVVLGYATVKDDKGEEMHKTKGNSIPFDEAIDKMGADVMRWMYARHNPANDVCFSYETGRDIYKYLFDKLFNTYAFLVMYSGLWEFTPEWKHVGCTHLDKWLVSELHLLIKQAKEAYESYKLAPFCESVEFFVNEQLSNWWLRRTRRRASVQNTEMDRLSALNTLHYVLVHLCQIMAPISPFMTDEIYRHITKEQSVHLSDFPVCDIEKIDPELNEGMKFVKEVTSTALALRNSAGIKVRQPLPSMFVLTDISKAKVLATFSCEIREEVNVKSFSFGCSTKEDEAGVINKDNVYLTIVFSKELELEGMARDLIREVQQKRKSEGLTIKDKADLTVFTGSRKWERVITAHQGYIERETQSSLRTLGGDANSFRVEVKKAG